jgi:hypothetical protein
MDAERFAQITTAAAAPRWTPRDSAALRSAGRTIVAVFQADGSGLDAVLDHQDRVAAAQAGRGRCTRRVATRRCRPT